MPYLFTSESVSEGHPDKVSDQISDAILDEFLKYDPIAKVACETLCTTDLVVIAGEVKANEEAQKNVDVEKVARETIRQIGYNHPDLKFDADSCQVENHLHEQSADINQGVDRADEENQGAGDQGMMFGFASRETDNYMPLALDLSHRLLLELAHIRKNEDVMPYLRPDAKSQVTIEYNDDNEPQAIKTIVLSTQHSEFIEPENNSPEAVAKAERQMQERIKDDIKNILLPRIKKSEKEEIQALFTEDIELLVNPTGKFIIGGPHGDTGLTGRKIIVDTYGGKGAHGGGAFSGKDSSKVDRSAAYATRHIARNLVAAGIADQVLVQVAYAIGVAKPVGLYVTTYGHTYALDDQGQPLTDGQISEVVKDIFDMRPYGIVHRLGLRNPIFQPTAAYGHMGRKSEHIQVEVYEENGKKTLKDFETFTWEKEDYVDKIRSAFRIENASVGA
jgi:S-adenosylmethionine synthetase